MSDEFGEAYGRVLRDTTLVLGELDGRTGEQALADGVPAREVWLALCRAQRRAARALVRRRASSATRARHAVTRVLSNICSKRT